MNIFKKILTTTALITTFSVSAVDVKRVSDINVGSLEQNSSPIKGELAVLPNVFDVDNIAVSIEEEMVSGSFIVLEPTGIKTEDLPELGLYVRGVETGWTEVGGLTDFYDNRLVFEVYYEGVDQHLYLSTNDGLDNPNVVGVEDYGQDTSFKPITSGGNFEKNVQFMIQPRAVDKQFELTSSVEFTVKDIIYPVGGSLEVVYGNTSTVVDLQSTLVPAVEDEMLSFKSDFDISNVPHQTFSLAFTGIRSGMKLELDGIVCTEDCTVELNMLPTESKPINLTLPESIFDYEVKVDTLVNGSFPLPTTTLFSGETNLNKYTVPYTYHVESNPYYYSAFTITPDEDTRVFFEMVVSKAGTGMNKVTEVFTDYELDLLNGLEMSTFSLETLLDLVGVESGNYHATVTFKSIGKLSINVDNVSPTGRTTVNVEKQDRVINN